MNKWDKRFIEMAELVATWSSCIRDGRQIGAIIVKDRRILTTGYNGAPSGIRNCKERGECIRTANNIPSGSNLETCYAVHAEQNAILQAAKHGIDLNGSILYSTHQPCIICSKMIINSGIKKVVYKHSYPDDFGIRLFKEGGVEIWQARD